MLPTEKQRIIFVKRFLQKIMVPPQNHNKETVQKLVKNSQTTSPKIFDDIPTLLEKARGFHSKGDYKNAIMYSEKVLEQDPLNADASNIRIYGYYHQGDEEKTIEICKEWLASEIQNQAPPLAMLQQIYEQKARREEKAHHLEKQARLIEQIKLDERTKLIGDLSHSIKNLISTVIDPLENLKQEAGAEKRIIENALRGANLIREIVHAMNLSSKGSVHDFYYDIKHNSGEGSSSLKTIITSALKYSIRNMFDGKYFSNFMRKYFPSRELYIEAKSEWEVLSQSESLEQLMPFLQRYFFKTDIATQDAENFIVGNQKGSAIKLLILFQELILNAVKYSAFVLPENRLLRVDFAADKHHVSLKIANRFKADVRTKTSGLGHVIIENLSQLFDANHKVNREDDVYVVSINFKNFWEKNTA